LKINNIIIFSLFRNAIPITISIRFIRRQNIPIKYIFFIIKKKKKNRTHVYIGILTIQHDFGTLVRRQNRAAFIHLWLLSCYISSLPYDEHVWCFCRAVDCVCVSGSSSYFELECNTSPASVYISILSNHANFKFYLIFFLFTFH
jgi:hypothetical protein